MRFFCAVFSFLALAACGSADAKTTDRPTLSVEYYQQDSARVIARWARPCDTKGCADSYRVRWMPTGRAIVERTVMRLVDTLLVGRPALGDSLDVTVAVTSLRRGIGGATRTARVVVRNPDAPPPPVDSLRADTTYATEADSVRAQFYTSDGKQLVGQIGMVEGDSIKAIIQLFLPPGTVRPPDDTTRWSSSGPAILRIQPVQKGLQDTAWLVAMDCACRESKDPVNPPMLDVRSGQYIVRDGAGYRPVTPLSADPFR